MDHKSISCSNIPDIFISEKLIAKQHFQKFGKVIRMVIRPKRKYCIVEYASSESAKNALHEGGNYDGFNFRITWTRQKSESVSKTMPIRKRIVPEKRREWSDDSDILAELDAMKSTGHNVFASRPEAKPVIPVFKKTSPKKTVVKPARTIKTEKKIKPKVKQTETEHRIAPNVSSEQAAELLKIISKTALTAEEKYRVLDARDKLIRLKMVRQSDLTHVSRTVGTCPDMCPEKERLMRVAQHQVAVYEQLGESKNSMNHSLAVKQYSRSSADQESPLAHELRPVNVLELTMGYLLHRIMDQCDSPDVNLAEWYHFLWDRTRGIRKDITQQELCCPGSVTLIEQCARFHIHCSARLVSEDVSVFDQKINTENLTKCLQTLKYMYHDLALQGVKCSNEAEFRGYIVLLNLNDGNFMWEVQQLSREIQESPEIKFALKVYSAIDKNNYVRFFKCVQSTTYLNACILLRYFNQVRLQAIRRILKSYSPRQPYTSFPISELTNILAFENNGSTIEYLEFHELPINAEGTHVLLDRKMFCQPDIPQLERAINIIESKRTCSVGEVVCGAPLPPKLYEQIVPHDSFDNGNLKLNEIPPDWHPQYKLLVNTEDKVDSGKILEAPKPEFTFHLPSDVKMDVNETLPENKTIFQFQSPKNILFSDKDIFKTTNIFSTPVQTFKFTEPKIETENKMEIANPWQNFFKNVQNIEDTEEKQIIEIPDEDFSDKTIETNFVTNETEKLNENENLEPTFDILQPNYEISQPIYENPQPMYEISEDIPEDYNEQEDSSPETEFEEKSHEIIPCQTFEVIPEPKTIPEIPTFDTIKNTNSNERRPSVSEEFTQKKPEIVKPKSKIHIISNVVIKPSQPVRIVNQEDIKTVLNEIIKKVEINNEIEIKLHKISEKIKYRKALKYANKWRNIVRVSKRKRKQFFDSPFWVSTKSVREIASELYSPSQNQLLDNIKRYKTGVSTFISTDVSPRKVKKLDITNTVWKILYDKFSEIHPQVDIFWKVSLSVYIKLENKFVNNFLKDLFDWNNLHTVHSSKINSLTFTYSIEKNETPQNDTNGILLIVDSSSLQKLYENFPRMIRNKKFTPVLILVINSEKSRQDIIHNLKIENFREHLTSYEVVVTKSSVTVPLIIASLQWLAHNTPPIPPLQLNTCTWLLESCTGEEFFDRLKSSSKLNRRLEVLLQDPNITIRLYNKCLDYLLIILQNPILKLYSSFPVEFREFVKSDLVLLPCGYEYFPDDWKSDKFIRNFITVIDSMRLPEFTGNWPPESTKDFEYSIEEYCSLIFENNKAFVLICNYFLCENFVPESIIWTDILSIIVTEKISSLQNSVLAVYKETDISEFRKIPWWYHTPEISTKIREVTDFYEELSEEEFEDEIIIDIDTTVLEAENSLKDDEKTIDFKKNFKDLCLMVEDLEESLKIEKKIVKKFNETALSILNEPLFTDDVL